MFVRSRRDTLLASALSNIAEVHQCRRVMWLRTANSTTSRSSAQNVNPWLQ